MVENAKYEVVKKLDSVEIRHYPSLIIARVEENRDGAFDVLFRFISGENRQRAKVKMTTPVVSEQIEMTAPVLSDTGSLAFIMPKEYKLDNTPDPIDNRVKIVEVPERSVAVLRFSGRWSQSIFNAKSKELVEKLVQAKVKTKSNVFAMLYNSPYTPWFMRRNEVATEVELG